MVIYTSISRTGGPSTSSVVLVEYALATGNFTSIANTITDKMSNQPNNQMSYAYDRYYFHAIKYNNLIYLCLAEEGYPQGRAFQFLKDIQTSFISEYGTQSQTAEAYQLSNFSNTIARLLKNFTEPDKVTAVKNEVNQVRDLMAKNIEKVINRGENLDSIADRTASLAQQSQQFRTRSRALNRAMWWKNQKLMILMGSSGVLLFYCLVGFGCGFPAWHTCVGSS
ncbi:Vesicle-associated membrane protein 7 [Globomyces sp. JEL0801]|nr:Vesicle-associated membrane protein 7 [Globomyces sp. JEL0801]